MIMIYFSYLSSESASWSKLRLLFRFLWNLPFWWYNVSEVSDILETKLESLQTNRICLFNIILYQTLLYFQLIIEVGDMVTFEAQVFVDDVGQNGHSLFG